MTMAYSLPPPRSRIETIDRLDALGRLLDSAVRILGTSIRVGAGAMLNFVPGVVTLVAKGLSSYLILEARRHAVPTATLLRPAGNVGVDFAINVVPMVGWFGDAFFRANQRNIALLRADLDYGAAR